jgi:hypothetical protein
LTIIWKVASLNNNNRAELDFVDLNKTPHLIPGENTSKVIFDYYLEDEKWHSMDESERPIYIDNCLKSSDQVQQEDQFICKAVQNGLESSAYDLGRYAPGVEMADHAFHVLLAKKYHNYLSQ